MPQSRITFDFLEFAKYLFNKELLHYYYISSYTHVIFLLHFYMIKDMRVVLTSQFVFKIFYYQLSKITNC